MVDIEPAEKKEILELIRYILRYDPNQRPTVGQLLNHHWFLVESEKDLRKRKEKEAEDETGKGGEGKGKERGG